MVKSMTGYGIAKGQAGDQPVTVEIRSLNSKFLELNMRVPSQFRDKEVELRSEISRKLERGKADVSITFETADLTRRNTINRDLFAAYYNELKSLTTEFGIQEQNILDIILRMPAVLNTDKADSDEEQWTGLNAVFQKAVAHFDQFRVAEGAVLEKELRERVQAIVNALPLVEAQEGQRIENIRGRLSRNLAEIKEAAASDANRFEQELIYYLEKLDIAEEKLRLRTHCEYFLQTLSSPEANGKKLGFIGQEIGREINTMGAKANDAIIQRIVVEMKDELEKLKEQLANVL